MMSVALCLPLLAAFFGAAPASPYRMPLPAIVDVVDDSSVPTQRRRLPSVTSRAAVAIAMKRAAATAM